MSVSYDFIYVWNLKNPNSETEQIRVCQKWEGEGEGWWKWGRNFQL